MIADKEQSKCPEENLAFCLFAHKKLHMDCPRCEARW